MKLLDLLKHSTNVPVIGVGGVKSQIRHRVNLNLSSGYTKFERDLEYLVTTRVAGRIPSVPVNVSKWKFPNGIVFQEMWIC